MSRRRRSWSVTTACTLVIVAAPALVTAIATPAIGSADSCDDVCAAVLAQEQRWLTAITDGDTATVESILAPGFKHVTATGQLFDRAQEIANLKPEPFVMNPTEQIVDIAGDTAVVHGVNTVTQGDDVLAHERFTDTFVRQNGSWLALAAQETAF
ncbi:hypothetical protein BH09ACT7_BH09ACT7_26880 [soil metagenome]